MIVALSLTLLAFLQTVPEPTAQAIEPTWLDLTGIAKDTRFGSDKAGRIVQCYPPAGQPRTPEFDAACRDALKRNAKARRLTPLNRAAWLKGISLSGGPRRASFQLDVEPNGRVARCRILRPSGRPDTDEEICVQLSRHAHFIVARTSDGSPVASTYRNDVRW